MTNNGKTKDETPIEQTTEPQPPPEKEPESNDQKRELSDIWEQITESLKDDGPRINAAIQQAKPKPVSEDKILIHISAESHKDLYQKFSSKIIDILRKEWNNNALEFEYKLIESETENNRPLTHAEKYKKLSEQNPALELLRKKFNLDIKK